MAEQNFVDYVRVNMRSGRGGPGSTHLLRDKITSKGGPDGGDGGRGGHVILRGSNHVWTLLPFRWRKHIIAKDGASGSGNHSSGKSGEDVVMEVPLGTILKDPETNEVLAEITEVGQEVIAARGGRGGLGNAHFKNAVLQTPRFAQPGEDGVEHWRVLELKMLADVGLVGFPNAGKSTLLSVMTAAKPKIANYPFTTIVPNLGIVKYRDTRSFVIADIPGIIEDAHEGKGLGHRFLRHIERNAVLLFLVPADADNIRKEYEILLNELEMYNPELLDKPRILAISKSDLIDEELKELLQPEIPTELPHIFISAVAQRGLTELKDLLWDTITKNNEPA